MRIVLSALVLLLIAGSLAGGFYALNATEPVETSAGVEPTESTEMPAVEHLRRSDEPRSVWKEPKRELPAFDASQPRPRDLTPEIVEADSENGISYSKPASDTQTEVAVTTCEGERFEVNDAEKQMLDMHTEERVKRGLKPLCVSEALTYVARQHSQDMLSRNYFSHYSPENLSVTERMGELGYPVRTRYGTGENIALGGDYEGMGTPQYMFDALMNSPGHRANILNGDFEEVGVGAVRGYYESESDPATAYTIDFGYWADR